MMDSAANEMIEVANPKNGRKKKRLALILVSFLLVSVLAAVAVAGLLFVKTKDTLSEQITGNTVVFGKYEQDGNPENGPEDIEWSVLESNDAGTLLVSKKCLEYLPFSDKGEKADSDTWKTSTLRKWLNDEFYDDAFSLIEKRLINETPMSVSVDDGTVLPDYLKMSPTRSDYGSETNDKVFILTFFDYKKHKEITEVEYSEYAKGLLCSDLSIQEYDPQVGYYWTRTLGGDVGSVVEIGYFQWLSGPQNKSGVRPAIWVSVRKGD